MNPFEGVAKFFLGVLEQKTLQSWAKLLFCLFASGLLSFLFICGTLLTATGEWEIAIGTGMVVSAVCMTVVFRSSPLTKGLLLVLPAAEATKELQTDLQKIQR